MDRQLRSWALVRPEVAGKGGLTQVGEPFHRSRRTLAWLVGVGVLSAASVLGCGSKGTVPAEGAEQSATRKGERATPPEPPPPSPVEAPPGVVARGRIRSPGRLIDQALAMSGVPFDWRAKLAREEPKLGRVLSSAIDPMLPIEAVVVLSPIVGREPFAIHSYGARGVWPVLGVLDVEYIPYVQGPHQAYYFRYEGEHCAVGRALGPAPARVVCAASETSLRELLAYALAGLPREELSPADGYFQFVAEPLQEQYGKQLKALRLGAAVLARQFQLDSPRFDRALTDLAVGVAAELEDVSLDIREVEMELYGSDQGFRFEASAEFAGHRSWTVAALGDLAAASGPAPEVFDVLPQTSSSAAYSRLLPRSRTSRIRSVLVDLFAGYAQAKGTSLATTQRVEKVVEGLMQFERPIASATGSLVLVRDGKERVLVPAWSLIGIEGKSKPVLELLADTAALLSARDLEKVLEEPPSKFASLTMSNKKLRGLPSATVYRWSTPLMTELQEHARDVEPETLSRLNRLGKGYLAVVEIAGTTWISVGPEEESLGEPLRALASKDTARLGSDPGLSALRRKKLAGAGFMKVDGVVGSFSAFLPDNIAKEWTSLLAATPGGGRTPATYELSAESGDSTRLVYRVDVPEAFVGDCVALAILAAAEPD